MYMKSNIKADLQFCVRNNGRTCAVASILDARHGVAVVHREESHGAHQHEEMQRDLTHGTIDSFQES